MPMVVPIVACDDFVVAERTNHGRKRGLLEITHLAKGFDGSVFSFAEDSEMNNGNVSDPVGRAVCDLSPTPPAHHVVALYPFKGSNNDELCFRKGDVITVTQMEDGGWWEGTLRGRTGWFPSNYVKECEPVGDALLGSSSASSPSSSSLLAPQQQLTNRVKILENFMEAERLYLEEMSQFRAELVPPLQTHEKLNLEDLTGLFNELEKLVETHCQLLNAVVAESQSGPGDDANGNDRSSLNNNGIGNSGAGSRIGKVFLNSAADIKTVHTTYSRAHPRAIAVIDKFRDEINAHLMTSTSGSGGVIVLIKKLSGPFRRLSQYPLFLHEWKGQLEDSHPDRGDSQRAAQFFRDVVAECSALRREAELELEVINGNVTDWDTSQCPPPRQLGAILKMSRILLNWATVIPKAGETSSKAHETSAVHRFLVAFTRHLVVLSTVPAMTSFVFQGNVPFKHITSIELGEDTEGKSFAIDGPNMDRLTATFEQKSDCKDWVKLIEQQTGVTASGGRRGSSTSTASNKTVSANQPFQQQHRRQSSLDLPEVDKATEDGTFRRGGSLRGVSFGAPKKTSGPFPILSRAANSVLVPVVVSASTAAATAALVPSATSFVPSSTPPVLSSFQHQPHQAFAAPVQATKRIGTGAKHHVLLDSPWIPGVDSNLRAKSNAEPGDQLLTEIFETYSKMRFSGSFSSQGPFHVGFVESRPLESVRMVEENRRISDNTLAGTVHALAEQVHRIQRDLTMLARSHRQLITALQPRVRADAQNFPNPQAATTDTESAWDAIVRPLVMDV